MDPLTRTGKIGHSQAKRQQQSALLTAHSDRLDTLYCRDPETEELGIYPVFGSVRART